jgi:FMN phosphatase YigB (HAD superfamily)
LVAGPEYLPVTDSVEAVLFDIDDTVCRYRQSIGEVLDVAFDRAGVDPFFTPADYRARYPEFAQASDGVGELRSRCFVSFARDAGLAPSVGRTVASVYAEERDHGQVRLTEGAGEALDHVTEHYRVAAVTNGPPEIQAPKLDTLGLRGRFETVVHAGYDAPAKPAPEPFHRALSFLEADASRAVHVGNSLASDVAGAHAAGLHSAWLPDGTAGTPDPKPDYTLETLGDLTDPPWRT